MVTGGEPKNFFDITAVLRPKPFLIAIIFPGYAETSSLMATNLRNDFGGKKGTLLWIGKRLIILNMIQL